MRDEIRRNLRVGMLVAAATAVLAVTILTIGERRQLFIRHTRYFTTFSNVLGLKPGAPVNLDGVTVGFVRSIELGTHPSEQRITVWFAINVEYTERIRTDTRASIKTIGLLGDKYLELSGGTPGTARVLEGGMVQGQDPAELTRFLAGGEDLMDNLLGISSSLRVILHRVEAGEGLIGELTQTPDSGAKVVDRITSALIQLEAVLAQVNQGQGVVGRLVADEELADRLLGELDQGVGALRQMAEALRDDLSRTDTAYAGLLRDPEGAKLVGEAVRALHDASEALAVVAGELASGEGTLPRLIQDEEFAADFLDELAELVRSLRSAAQKLDRGEGSAGAFINDPHLYEDLENVVRGVKSSKTLSWLIRNRREAGERVAAEELEEAAAAAGESSFPDEMGGM